MIGPLISLSVIDGQFLHIHFHQFAGNLSRMKLNSFQNILPMDFEKPLFKFFRGNNYEKIIFIKTSIFILKDIYIFTGFILNLLLGINLLEN